LVHKKEWNGWEDVLIANLFGSPGEVRDDITKLHFYPYNLTKVS
jgi:hypothetical protein